MVGICKLGEIGMVGKMDGNGKRLGDERWVVWEWWGFALCMC